jgi:hypothetical protein
VASLIVISPGTVMFWIEDNPKTSITPLRGVILDFGNQMTGRD